ncbi:MAG: hypothetical protein WD204_04085 [Acidimicrobiia bacterium]
MTGSSEAMVATVSATRVSAIMIGGETLTASTVIGGAMILVAASLAVLERP